MSRFVRASKVRNVFPDAPKAEQTWRSTKFKEVGASDAQGVKCNGDFIGMRYGSNGSIGILDIKNPARMDSVPVLFHADAVIDFDFSPFHNNVVASGDNAGTVRVWGFDEGGLKETLNEPLTEMEGIFDKAVSAVLYHPLADNLLTCASQDSMVKSFDLLAAGEDGPPAVWEKQFDAPVLHMSYSGDGEVLAVSCKDQNLYLINPRTGEEMAKKKTHDGRKTHKSFFMDNFGAGQGNLGTCGFTTTAKRQLGLWDKRKFDSAVTMWSETGSSGSVWWPFYDPDLKMIFCQGKGEQKSFVFEVVDESPWVFNVHDKPVAKEGVKGACMLAKRHMNVMRDGGHQNKGPEVNRMYHVYRNSVVPVSWVIPRKNTKYWSELFPDAIAGSTKLTAEAFFSGTKGKVMRITMDPKKRAKGAGATGGGTSGGGTVTQKKTKVQELTEEVKRLKALLDKNNIKY